MKKNILVISSSPRKGGNSDTLCNEFIKGATDAGHYAEKIFLRDKNIHYCTGCGVCYNQKQCSQKDDMAELLDKMVAADTIVLSTPIYFYTMCGQLKTFIDRCCARYTEMSNKNFYYIMTAADTSLPAMDRTIVEFQGFLACLENPIEQKTLKAFGVWQKEDIKDSKYIAEAYEMGRLI